MIEAALRSAPTDLEGTAPAGPSSASLHEAAGRIGALPSSLRSISRMMAVSGWALPVRCPPGDNLWLHRALVLARPGDVLVIDTQGGTEFGYWGEVMATAAIRAGIAGLVITGGVRDTLALIELGLPTFSTGACIRGTGKDPNLAGSVGEPITLGDVTIERGDLIVGDADGVVAVPARSADAAIAAALARDQDEVSILARLRAGATTIEVYGLPIQSENFAP